MTGCLPGVFVVALVFLLYQCALILAPFASPLFLAAVAALMTYPLREYSIRHFGWSPTVAATVMTASVVLPIVIPVLFLLVLLVQDANELRDRVQAMIEMPEHRALLSERVTEAWSRVTEKLPFLSSVGVMLVFLDISRETWLAPAKG